MVSRAIKYAFSLLVILCGSSMLLTRGVALGDREPLSDTADSLRGDTAAAAAPLARIATPKLLVDTLSPDSVGRKRPQDEIFRFTDSLLERFFIYDSVMRRTSQTRALGYDVQDRYLPDTTASKRKFLDEPIFLKSKDSIVYNMTTNTIQVYAGGDVKYTDMSLMADYVAMNTKTKEVHAEGVVVDTVTKKPTRVVFKQGQASYDVDSMNYNMESSKGLIKGVNTKDGEGILYGGTVKKMKDNVMHMHQGRYTVCDAECPHFYMQMTKGSVVPGKQVVFGPSYLVFEGVPIYFLGVPFGFFPQKRERSHGIIFPEIGEEYVKGFFIRNFGYYVPIGEYFDFFVKGGIYTLGSWQVGAGAAYSLRYKFNGSLAFDYASDKIGDAGSPDYVETTNVALRWNHVQDAKFSPGSTFSASVNYTSSSYNKYNAQNMNDYLNSQTSSTVNYSKSWAGKPFSLSVNAALSQNSHDSTMTISLPSLSFNVARVAPFKRKVMVGKERWYEKINFTYSFRFQNEANQFKDKDFFQDGMFQKMRTGIQHNIPISASFNLFQYLNITPSINYGESWYFRRIDQRWSDEANGGGGGVVRDTSNGFYRLWQASVSMSMETKMYGTYTMGHGKKVSIIRHILSPSLGFSFSPDNGARYYRSVQTNKEATEFRDYSPYESEMYGTPSRGRAASLNFSLNNTIEGKFPSAKDSTGFKKIKLIDQLSLSGSYNFIADSMNLSNISVRLNTNLLKQVPINVSASFDPYAVDANRRRINKFLVSEGGFLRLASLSFSFGYNFQSKKSSDPNAVNNPEKTGNDLYTAALNEEQNNTGFFNQEGQRRQTSKDLALLSAAQYYDFDIPWSLGFSYQFNYTDNGSGPSVNQTVNMNASINITQKWGVSASAGYDFVLNKITPGTIRITRDLHCWQMSLNWVPIGFRQSWSFNISVKSAMLADVLKWDKNNSFLDNYYYNATR